jgi:hypothetical protein
MMRPLATKQSGGKLLPHSDLRGGVFLGEASRKLREMKLGSGTLGVFIGQVPFRLQRGN